MLLIPNLHFQNLGNNSPIIFPRPPNAHHSANQFPPPWMRRWPPPAERNMTMRNDKLVAHKDNEKILLDKCGVCLLVENWSHFPPPPPRDATTREALRRRQISTLLPGWLCYALVCQRDLPRGQSLFMRMRAKSFLWDRPTDPLPRSPRQLGGGSVDWPLSVCHISCYPRTRLGHARSFDALKKRNP